MYCYSTLEFYPISSQKIKMYCYSTLEFYPIMQGMLYNLKIFFPIRVELQTKSTFSLTASFAQSSSLKQLPEWNMLLVAIKLNIFEQTAIPNINGFLKNISLIELLLNILFIVSCILVVFRYMF